MRTIAKVILVAGLALCVAAFTMLDRGWLTDSTGPVSVVNHPIAGIVGLCGLILSLTAAGMLRKSTPS